jgi:hypothetical protein
MANLDLLNVLDKRALIDRPEDAVPRHNPHGPTPEQV